MSDSENLNIQSDFELDFEEESDFEINFEEESDFEEEYKEDEYQQQFEDTFKDSERANIRPEYMKHNIMRQFDRKENYNDILLAILMKFLEENEISENDINIINKSTTYVENMIYKNPYAYILGYISTKEGLNKLKKNINKIFVSKGFAISEAILEGNIKPEDIIRYSRLWMNIREKYSVELQIN